jgi:hypothetical protein
MHTRKHVAARAPRAMVPLQEINARAKNALADDWMELKQYD